MCVAACWDQKLEAIKLNAVNTDPRSTTWAVRRTMAEVGNYCRASATELQHDHKRVQKQRWVFLRKFRSVRQQELKKQEPAVPQLKV
jgi:hypothetical protein